MPNVSVHNLITKLVGDKHERWPDLLGTVALAYNATVHTSTGYSPHELFYSFAPACPLDALVSTPMPQPASNADEYALQAMERLQEAAQFVRSFTGKQMERMKKHYDASVKPKWFEENEEVLLFNPRKKRGQFAKWQVTWTGPFWVKRRLNDCNYTLQKSAKSKPFVVHVNRMRKYQSEKADDDCTAGATRPLSTALDNSLRPPGQKPGTALADGVSLPEKLDITDGHSIASTSPTGVVTLPAMAPATTGVDTLTRERACASDISSTGAGQSTANARARDYVTADTANKPRLPRVDRPQRTSRTPARLLGRIHARRCESELQSELQAIFVD